MSTIDQQIAQLSNEGRKRRSNDWAATVILGGACVTVLATWGFGYFTHDWWLRESEAGVYNSKARVTGDYFLTDWTWGCFFALALLAAFLILRPWSHRIGSVIFGVLVAAGAGVALWYSLQQWDVAEAKTVEVLRTTAYPWSDGKYSCGSDEWTDSKGNLWAVDTGRYTNSGHESCDNVLVFKGWKEIGHEDIPDEAMSRFDGADTSVEITDDGTVTVSMSGEVVLRFPIKKPSDKGCRHTC